MLVEENRNYPNATVCAIISPFAMNKEVFHGTTMRRILEFTDQGSTQDLFGV